MEGTERAGVEERYMAMNARWERIAEWAARTVLVTVVCAGVLHEVRLGSIESNRFTDADAAELKAGVIEALTRHSQTPNHQAAGVELGLLRERLTRMESKLDRLLERHSVLEGSR